MTAETNFKLPIPSMGETSFNANVIQDGATESLRNVSARILKITLPADNASTPKIVSIDSSSIRLSSPQPNGEQMVEGIIDHLVHLSEKTELLGNIIPSQDPPEPNNLLPPEWYQIEPTAMPPRHEADVNAVVDLITSGKGMVQDGNSPIFLEGQRFPHACLHAYIEDKITLSQLVSSIMLFSALKEFGIDSTHADKVQRVELQGAQDEPFPAAPNASGEERCYYRIEIPNYDNVSEGTRQYFSSDDFIPSQFVMNGTKEIAIPSYSSMQTYLNNKYGDESVQFLPRWGNSSMHEIYQQAGTKKRVFGLDPEGKSKPDGVNYGPYGVLLHDFYHANLLSNIPVSNQKAYKAMSLHLLDVAKSIDVKDIDVKEVRAARPPRNQKPLDPSLTDADLKKQIGSSLENIVRQTAWNVLDMDIAYYKVMGPPKDFSESMNMIDNAVGSFKQRALRPPPDYPWYLEDVLQDRVDAIIERAAVKAQKQLLG